MEILDAEALGKQALRLGLLTEDQFKDALEEAGTRNPEVPMLIRILERKTVLTPWQSAKLLKGDFDGFFLGGYRLLYRISSGSFGRVYRADDPASGRIVAIKVLRRRWSEDANRISGMPDYYRPIIGVPFRAPIQIITIASIAPAKQTSFLRKYRE